MENIQYSKLLTTLLEETKKIDGAGNPPYTAEKFLVAVIEKIKEIAGKESKLERDVAAEAKVLKEHLEEHIKDVEVAKTTLMAYVQQEKSTTYLDERYMKRMLYKAERSCIEAEASECDAAALFLCIMASPSAIIRVARDNASRKPVENHPQKKEEGEEVFDLAEELEFGDYDDFDELDAEDVVNQAGAKNQMANLVAGVKRIRAELQSKVFGQDNAINVFLTGYFQANMRSMLEKNRKRPSATFLFAGPPGVGKTFLAESVAASLGRPFMRFDMSEYADKEANLEFCGSDKVYRNSKPGNVTSFVAKHPKCVLLFDEIEKAHMCVIHLFLQMLDAGRLRDNNTDAEVSFTDAIIILTTNAGRRLYENSESGDFSSVSRKVIIKALEKDVNPETGVPFFPGAICSRFASGNVVMFNHMNAHNLREIAKSEIEKHAARLEEETGIKLEIEDPVYTALLFAEGSAADARTIKSRAETFFNDEFYELLRMIASEKAKTNINNVEKVRISVDMQNMKPDITALFSAKEKIRVLLFTNDETAALCKSKVPGLDFICVQDTQTAIETIKNQSIDFILMDITCGATGDSLAKLNLEDVESPARSFFKFLKEQNNALPVYLVEEQGMVIDEEEKISFMRQGVRGILPIGRRKDAFATQLNTIAEALHQQASMIKLARENKLVSFETAQTVSESGENAEIKLFDFEMRVAVDAEDAKNVMSAVSRPKVRFKDVIGAGDAKTELQYFVEYLKNPKKYMGTGVKAPKGVILYGPPGTGKTMLAKAMACEADVTFIAAEGNEFLKSIVGQGAERVHELFRTARKYAPSILFIDEIDAIARERKGGENASANGEGTLTAFLTEMDGFASDPSKPVFVLAATNFEVTPGTDKSLDPALMRRFDRRVYIDLPNREDRDRFLRMKIEENKALKISEKQIDNIAMRSTGMSLAELDSVVELALRSAIREGSTVVNDAILEEAFETFNGGAVKKWDESQLERVARHEAGHAFLSWLSGETPSYLTIVARGDHGGYMQHAEQEGKALYTKDELLARIRTSLGGRAAEIAYYGERDGISTGASGDLASATNLAHHIVCTYGMDEDFGLAVVYGAVAANGTMSVEVRAAVKRILREQMAEAVQLISENKAKIDALVADLMLKNHLNSEEIEASLSRRAGSAAAKNTAN